MSPYRRHLMFVMHRAIFYEHANYTTLFLVQRSSTVGQQIKPLFTLFTQILYFTQCGYFIIILSIPLSVYRGRHRTPVLHRLRAFELR